MKLKFDHNKVGVMESLGVTRDRMDVIMSESNRKLKEKYESGTKMNMLDYMLQECETNAEAIATAIVWDTVSTQMEKMNFLREEEKKKSNIIKPDMKIIKP